MLLLDKCTLIWLTSDQTKLSSAAKQALHTETGKIYVSAISGFEVAQKAAKGKLILPHEPSRWMEMALRLHGLEALPLEMNCALAAGALPPLHADPFDRLIVATAQVHRLTLLTPDPMICQYPALVTLW